MIRYTATCENCGNEDSDDMIVEFDVDTCDNCGDEFCDNCFNDELRECEECGGRMCGCTVFIDGECKDCHDDKIGEETNG